jgi:hypothetical protein
MIGMDEMEQSGMILFLRLEGRSKRVIHHELVMVLQENVVSHSSVTKFCREANLGLNSEEISLSPKEVSIDEANEAVLLTLSELAKVWVVSRFKPFEIWWVREGEARFSIRIIHRKLNHS